MSKHYIIESLKDGIPWDVFLPGDTFVVKTPWLSVRGYFYDTFNQTIEVNVIWLVISKHENVTLICSQIRKDPIYVNFCFNILSHVGMKMVII
jgi:hypothetical protein